MYICICNQINEARLREEIECGATTVRQLRESLGVTKQCGKCTSSVKSCINRQANINSHTSTFFSSACNA